MHFKDFGQEAVAHLKKQNLMNIHSIEDSEDFSSTAETSE
jgi:hypothetical protein